MTNMKIADIRRVIESASWSRNDLSGSTREEFRRCDVAARLGKHIAALQSLQIPARFVSDIQDRAYEIEACGKVIARWQAANADHARAAAKQPTGIDFQAIGLLQGGRA